MIGDIITGRRVASMEAIEKAGDYFGPVMTWGPEKLLTFIFVCGFIGHTEKQIHGRRMGAHVVCGRCLCYLYEGRAYGSRQRLYKWF